MAFIASQPPCARHRSSGFLGLQDPREDRRPHHSVCTSAATAASATPVAPACTPTERPACLHGPLSPAHHVSFTLVRAPLLPGAQSKNCAELGRGIALRRALCWVASLHASGHQETRYIYVDVRVRAEHAWAPLSAAACSSRSRLSAPAALVGGDPPTARSAAATALSAFFSSRCAPCRAYARGGAMLRRACWAAQCAHCAKGA